jgi:hypothetical protein
MDLLAGDPRNIPHPVVWAGKLIALLDRKLLGDIPEDRTDHEKRDRKAERCKGLILVLIVITVTASLTAALMHASYSISPLAGVIAEAVLTCYMLAQTSLRRESMKVYRELKEGSLEGARKAVSMIVGRDTQVLDAEGVTKAAVETVAENFSDGVIAPMLYAAIGGPVLGMTYKAINTMDSMIGYRNDRYMWFGTAAARLDDAAGHNRNAALEKRNRTRVHHRGSRNACERAVGEKSAEADRQKKKRLKAFDDSEVEHQKADRNHNELTDTVRHAKKHSYGVTLMEGSLLIEVATVPLTFLVVVTIAVSSKVFPFALLG